jgi:hypothetical protein
VLNIFLFFQKKKKQQSIVHNVRILAGGKGGLQSGNGRQPPKGGYNNFQKGGNRNRGQNFNNGPKPWQNNNQEFAPSAAPPNNANNNRNKNLQRKNQGGKPRGGN